MTPLPKHDIPPRDLTPQEDDFRQLFSSIRARLRPSNANIPDRVIDKVQDFEEARLESPSFVDVVQDAVSNFIASLLFARKRFDDDDDE